MASQSGLSDGRYASSASSALGSDFVFFRHYRSSARSAGKSRTVTGAHEPTAAAPHTPVHTGASNALVCVGDAAAPSPPRSAASSRVSDSFFERLAVQQQRARELTAADAAISQEAADAKEMHTECSMVLHAAARAQLEQGGAAAAAIVQPHARSQAQRKRDLRTPRRAIEPYALTLATHDMSSNAIISSYALAAPEDRPERRYKAAAAQPLPLAAPAGNGDATLAEASSFEHDEDHFFAALRTHAAASAPALLGRQKSGAPLITTKMRERVNRRRAAHALVQVLPLYSHLDVLGRTIESVVQRAELEGDEYVLNFLERLVTYYARWGVSSIKGGSSTLGRLRDFASNMDDDEAAEACVFSPDIADQWLTLVGVLAKRKHEAVVAKAAAENRELTNAQKRRDGTRAEDTAFRQLRWLHDNAKVRTSARDPLVSKRIVGKPVPMPTRGIDPPHYVHLCHLAAHGGTRLVRGTSAGFATVAAQIFRMQQAQQAVVLGERGGILWTATQKDKSNEPRKQRARPAFGPLHDAFDSRGVVDALYDALAGVEEGCFIVRDNSSLTGTLDDGAVFVDAPMPTARADRALQQLLMMPPLAMPEAEAKEFTCRSLKPFMLKQAARMGSDPLRRHGIGRFAGSAAQDPALVPEEALLRQHRVRCAQLPDRYAQSAALGADARESLRIMNSIRALAAAHSITQLAAMDWAESPELDDDADE